MLETPGVAVRGTRGRSPTDQLLVHWLSCVPHMLAAQVLQAGPLKFGEPNTHELHLNSLHVSSA